MRGWIHLGWRTLPAGGGDDDRLLLVDEHRQDQATTATEPVVQFLDLQDRPQNQTAAQEGEPLHFLEVQDETFEAPPFLWGGENDPEADKGDASVVIFGESSGEPAKTVFS